MLYEVITPLHARVPRCRHGQRAGVLRTADEAAIVEIGFARSRLGRRFARWEQTVAALEVDPRTATALRERRPVITSYSIHYTKLYEVVDDPGNHATRRPAAQELEPRAVEAVLLRLGARHRDPGDPVVIDDPQPQVGVLRVEDDDLFQLRESAVEGEEEDDRRRGERA